MTPALNLDQLLAKLRRAIGKTPLRQFAARVPMSAGTLHDVLNKRRRPGPILLDYMGMEARSTTVTVYVPKKS